MPTPTGTPFYASAGDLMSQFGRSQVLRWSDVDGTGQMNNERINIALLNADAEINLSFATAGFYSCGQGQNLSLGAVSTTITNRWALYLAIDWLYGPRKMNDKNYMDTYELAVEKSRSEIKLAASGGMQGFDAGSRWPQSNGAPWVSSDIPGIFG